MNEHTGRSSSSVATATLDRTSAKQNHSGSQLLHPQPTQPCDLEQHEIPQEFTLIDDMNLLLVKFAQWAGWLIFMDENKINSYIASEETRKQTDRVRKSPSQV